MERFGFIALLCIFFIASGFSLINNQGEGSSTTSVLIFKKRLNKKYDTGYHLDVTYPEVRCRNIDQGYEINKHIHKLTSGAISDFTKRVQQLYKPSEGYHYMNLDYTVHYTDSYMISVRFKKSSQFIGYKQAPDFSTTFNYDLIQGKVVRFNELFDDQSTYQRKLSHLLYKTEGVKVPQSMFSASTKFCVNSYFLTIFIKNPSGTIDNYQLKWSAIASLLNEENRALSDYANN